MITVNSLPTKLNRLITLFLIMSLLATSLPFMSLARPANQGGLRLQPELLVLVEEHPEQVVSVIVQQLASNGQAQALVEELGGLITHDLSMINAFAADLPASVLPILARSSAVRWISLNAGMVESQSGGGFVYSTWANEIGQGANVKRADFRNTPIPAGRTIWFSGVLKAKDLKGNNATVSMVNAQVRFTVGDQEYVLDLPNGRVEFSQAYASAATVFADAAWVTTVPVSYEKEAFVTGFAYTVPHDLPGDIKNVTWSARFLSDNREMQFDWEWAAAVYTQFGSDYNALGVKPVNKKDALNPYMNDNKAGTPENFKANVVKGARGDGGDKYTGDFSGGVTGILGYADLSAALAEQGVDTAFATANRGGDTVAGFGGQFTPGYAISKVELVLHSYVANPISDDVKVVLSMGGWHKDVSIKKDWANAFLGEFNAGDIVVDVTSARDWQWYDLQDLALTLDHNALKSGQAIKYDAIGLRVTTMPGEAVDKVKFPKPKPAEALDASKLISVYNQTIRSTEVWNEGPGYLQGQGVTVAVVDSGVGKSKDLGDRKFQDVNFNRAYHDGKDKYGHGTFVASVVAGNGNHSKGEYMGVAPAANVLNVRVTDDHGMSTEADVIEALTWVLTNKDISIFEPNARQSVEEVAVFDDRVVAALYDLSLIHI